MDIALEAGADDISDDDDFYFVTCPPGDFISLIDAIEKNNIKLAESGIKYIPDVRIDVESKDAAEKILNLIDTLEDNEDVQEVYANYNIPADIVDELEE
jgi:transcriptional/translational regulatory protein YebC/TACO1